MVLENHFVKHTIEYHYKINEPIEGPKLNLLKTLCKKSQDSESKAKAFS